MNKKTAWLFAVVLASIGRLPAQQLPLTLLWKITGHGLQRPSYLYGTMHLTDKRIFNLGDSLYHAIESSQGFAIEIDPEQFTPMIIDEAQKTYLDRVLLKEMLPAGEFKKYGKILSQKLHKDENDLTTADVLREKNKWIQDSYRTGEMQTFLDIYLFDIARREGKWTGGVEDISDQENLLDAIDESDIRDIVRSPSDADSKKTVDLSEKFMINAYINNDLNTIDSISNSTDSMYIDGLLVQRNKKMARRMDSLSRVRSTVFAVGAAHLPGAKGLIALLRQRGFEVTPVFSSGKIPPSGYKVAAVPLPWHEVRDEDGFYRASMPGAPGKMALYGVTTMELYFDVFSSTIYMTAALKTPYSQKMADSVFGKMTAYYFSTPDYTKGKPLLLNNIPGREFTSKKGNYSHGYLLFKDGVMYLAIAMSMKKDSAAAPAINRFLHSYTILERKPADTASFTYINTVKAYRLELPAAPQPGGKLLNAFKDTTLQRELYLTTDPATGAYLIFGTNEAAPGYFIHNDSSLLAGIETSQKAKFTKIFVDTQYVSGGIRMLDLQGIAAKVPLMMKVHYQFRGNRWYALVGMYDTAKDNRSVERFFTSFSTLEYAPTEWNRFMAPDSSFTTWAPLNFRYQPAAATNHGDYNSLGNYQSYDSTRGDTYSVVLESLGKYAWQLSDSSFWEALIKKYQNKFPLSPLLRKKAITDGSGNGYELEIQEPGSANVKRSRILLNGDTLYTLVTIQGAPEINNAHNNEFFDSFHLTHFQPHPNLFVSKATQLLQDIAAPDSGLAAQASSYLRTAPFIKDELPLIHSALLQNYPIAANKEAVRNELVRIIVAMKDDASFAFARDRYGPADDTTRNLLLTVMASFRTSQHFGEIKDLLLHQTPHLAPAYSLSGQLCDSMALAATILPGLLPLVNDSIMAPTILAICRKLADSGMVPRNLLLPYQDDLLRLSGNDLIALAADPANYIDREYDLERLLAEIGSPAANRMLQKWSISNALYCQRDAVTYLLQNNQQINPVALQALAKNDGTRKEIYDSLKAYHQQKLFPAYYRTQKYFAQSLVAAASDDDPNSISYLGQNVVNFKGRSSRFFFFKVTFADDEHESSELGCAGPYPLDNTELTTNDATGTLYEVEDLDSTKLPVQKNALIKQMEESFEWHQKK